MYNKYFGRFPAPTDNKSETCIHVIRISTSFINQLLTDD